MPTIPSASWLDRQLKAPPSGLLRLLVQFDGPVLALSFGTLPTSRKIEQPGKKQVGQLLQASALALELPANATRALTHKCCFLRLGVLAPCSSQVTTCREIKSIDFPPAAAVKGTQTLAARSYQVRKCTETRPCQQQQPPACRRKTAGQVDQTPCSRHTTREKSCPLCSIKAMVSGTRLVNPIPCGSLHHIIKGKIDTQIYSQLSPAAFFGSSSSSMVPF